jgi:transposase
VISLGRKAWLSAGSDRASERCRRLGLIATAKLNDVDRQASLADELARIVDQPISRLGELLPWHWRKTSTLRDTAAA